MRSHGAGMLPEMGKSTKANPTRSQARREELRRQLLPRRSSRFWHAIRQPALLTTVVTLLAFAIVSSALVIWSRDQVKVLHGQIMQDTYVKRLDYTVEDAKATQERKLEARKSSPRIYQLNTSYLDRLEAALNGLPTAVASKTSLADIDHQLIQEFKLTDAGLAALQQMSTDGAPTRTWQRMVNALISEELTEHPLLTGEQFQIYSTTPAINRALLLSSGVRRRSLGRAIDLSEGADSPMASRVNELVREAGFPPNVAPFVSARVADEAQPTIIFDPEATQSDADQAEASVQPTRIEHRAGEVIYRRGEKLTPLQYDELVQESQQYWATSSAFQKWIPRQGVIGLMVIFAVFMGAYFYSVYPKIPKNPLRMSTLCVLMVSMLAVTVFITAEIPNFLLPAAIAPILFVTLIVLLAYDQRLAFLICALQVAMTAIAIEMGVGFFVLLLAGCGTAIGMLSDVRTRNTLIRATAMSAIVFFIGAILLGLVLTPTVDGFIYEILARAVFSGLAAFAVGFVVLGILPSIERLFDITTGMTLAELRDPKQPLLRQLQQKAPGTYHHSLQVANIAEAAADSIGADSLLVYVGALYHDIGKINKPEYFIENQGGGQNKHDKLSPAMSLLVIIGHVKDGVELAREYNLPRTVQHFIGSHHGTTLVEYFYHAAKTQAEHEDQTIDEFEFRYPGPKPHTKEAAILMLSDAVESASRALHDPNPARIAHLVSELSRKRLLDGQFDDCGLSFRELATIEKAITHRVAAIHHGRINYPDQVPVESEVQLSTTAAV
ncbi:MAG: HDIG domain-containing protein [Phycisphaerales bacterium]|nr:HDIG domain-containing protein [Phycisphaerales bacterium]